MSKVAAGMAAVVLGGGTVTAGAILLPKWLNGVDAELPIKLADFKAGVKDEGCVQSLFPGLKNLTAPTTEASAPQLDNNFLNTSDGKPKPESCLVVNWNKSNSTKTNESNKWKGTIRFLWAVRGEDKGFLMFLAGSTSNATDKKLKWEGTVNALVLAEGSWTVQKQQEVSDSAGKSFGPSTEDNKFPGPGNALGDVKNRSFWGFLSAKTDLNSVDEVEEFAESGGYRGYWRWKGTGGAEDQGLGGWTNSLSTWWNDIFTSSPWNMDAITQNQKGNWSSVVDDLGPRKVASNS